MIIWKDCTIEGKHTSSITH